MYNGKFETYESVVEIKNVVSYFRKSPYVVIYTDLVEAPLEWLLNNGYNKYYKPKKIKKVKQLKIKTWLTENYVWLVRKFGDLLVKQLEHEMKEL